MSNLSDIVNVTIAIESPASSTESYNDLLIVVPKATNAASASMPDCLKITSAAELTSYGYAATDTAYLAASAAFAQNPGPMYVYIADRRTTTSSGSTVTEALATTLDRAKTGNWYGFALADDSTASDVKSCADWAEANGKLFGFTWGGDSIPVDIKSYDRTFAMYRTATTGSYAAIALMAKCFTFDPGSETWALKTLNGVTTGDISATMINTIKDANSNYYVTVAGKNVTQGGMVGSGEWIDIIRFKDYLLNQIQIEEFSYLSQNKKVAFNDGGITGVENVLTGILAKAQANGGIDNNRYDADGNVEYGFTVSVPRASSLTTTERKSRKLNGVKFTARLAGAIHFTTIQGTLVY